MTTLIMYNDCISDMQYTILDGDYSHLNGVAINSGMNQDLERESVELLFDEETGDNLLQFYEDVSIVENKDWDKFCVITFLP
jgi:hypothetical protein